MLNSIWWSRSLDPIQWEIYRVFGYYMCISYVGPLIWWYSHGSEQCNNHIQEWWNLDPLWSHAFAYITWLTTCLTYMFYYFQGIKFASLVLNSSISYLHKIKIKARKFLGNDRTWHGIHSCTPCIFIHNRYSKIGDSYSDMVLSSEVQLNFLRHMFRNQLWNNYVWYTCKL